MSLLLPLALTGCSLFGHTRPTPVSLEPAALQAASPIDVASVEMDPTQSHLEVVGAYAIGRFGERDLDNLRVSLERSIPEADSDAGLDVHVYVRSYHVSASNNAAGALAAVAWCATDASGQLVYQEQFYAYDSAVLVRTMGALKNTVQEAAVQRIAEASVHLASGRPPADLAFPDNATLRYDHAVNTLPDTLQSHYTGLIGGIFFIAHSREGDADYGTDAEAFDWTTHLNQ